MKYDSIENWGAIFLSRHVMASINQAVGLRQFLGAKTVVSGTDTEFLAATVLGL